MSSRTKIALAITLVLYAVTGVAAWSKEAKLMAYKAQEGYDQAQKLQKKLEFECTAKGLRNSCAFNISYAAGPNWTVKVLPILPGVALINSAYYVGPKWAEGSTRIELWYGFGSITLQELGTWVS
ncbi:MULTISPECIES: hypothetical protein [unclassified Pseudomonas]|uniref:hypothetical protein n=1 Tax=unclassified Pseudomonas TaxID=196821 RepID=UPI00244B5E9B|nr:MULTISPECIES: hypothetical protein [unclassified Pseudomonas]MDG9926163.1 hypothetical protein [Pseudomonas sp. GD04045]MDH0037507.1 hypothetical protein [Pseudomonas sp. GD04019]